MHGLIMPWHLAGPRAEGYEWFEFMPHVDFELIPEEDEEDVYEVVFKVLPCILCSSECPQGAVIGEPMASLGSSQHKSWQYTCLCYKRSRRTAQVQSKVIQVSRSQR
jgi:hypothetical protein